MVAERGCAVLGVKSLFTSAFGVGRSAFGVPIDPDPDSDTDLDEACFPKHLSLSWFAFFVYGRGAGGCHFFCFFDASIVLRTLSTAGATCGISSGVIKKSFSPKHFGSKTITDVSFEVSTK